MSAHSSDCEHADPGSLCDCDCAGAKHAIARTKGAVPAAGQVSARAQKIAADAGRAAVVNNRAEPNGRGRRAPAAPGRPAGTKPRPVRTVTRAPRLSPTTKAHLNAVAAGLPKTRDDWHAAATQPLGGDARRQLDANVQSATAAVAAAEAALSALRAEHVDKEYRRLLRSKEGKAGRYGSKEQMKESAAALAPHRMWEDPAFDRLTGARYEAERSQREAERVRDRAVAAPAYPVDAATGIRMPTAELTGHLQAVKSAGRAALADAKQAWEKDPPAPVRAALQRLQQYNAVSQALHVLRRNKIRLEQPSATGGPGRFFATLPDEGNIHVTSIRQYEQLHKKYSLRLYDIAGTDSLRDAKHTVAKHQSDTVLAMLTEHRAFGGNGHSDVTTERDTHTEQQQQGKPQADHGVTAPRADWKQRLRTAEQYFPADWITASAAKPLKIGASRRAYYGGSNDRNLLSMTSDSVAARTGYDGALDDVDEVNVHELGHRMETIIPGLTHLEFAYVRQRGHNDDGGVQPIRPIAGYADQSEVSQEDKWGNAYAGKTYERYAGGDQAPGDAAWEVFQVGLQDLFARSSARFGPTDDPEELQAFVIGALLTLGRRG